MHYYQHHIGDYRKDTSHLSLLEHGAYRQLLDLYYISEKPLDANALRLICARTPDEQAATNQILSEFFTLENGLYFHNRCEDEITKFHSKSVKASESSKARWNKIKGLQDANALRTDSEGNANHKPITINHKPITNIKPKRAEALEDYFEDFWYKYPKKTGKLAARKAWDKMKPDILQVIDALNWQIPSRQWQEQDGRFILNPATYLNQGRWMDEAPTQEAPF
jgi:uncharacterized protein YdaU (DUF1376 family)